MGDDKAAFQIGNYAITHWRGAEVSGYSDQEINRYVARLIDKNNLKDRAAYFEFWKRDNKRETALDEEIEEDSLINACPIFALFKDNKVIGHFTLDKHPKNPEICEVFYGLDCSERGKALMPLLWEVGTRYALDQGFKIMVAEIDPDNEDSINTAYRWGMRKMGKGYYDDQYLLFSIDLDDIRQGKERPYCYNPNFKRHSGSSLEFKG